ncbi:MAG: hypothetical protein ACFFFD_14110 [Promethearchaeota archaeon]
MGNNILKTSGVYLLLAGLILLISFIMELLTGTIIIGQGLLSFDEELSFILSLSEIFPQVLVAYTLEVFAFLVCIPGLVGVAAFLSPQFHRKWIQTLVVSLLGIVIILYAFPSFFDGLLSAYHLTGSPPPAAVPGISRSASGDIYSFLVISSIGVTLLVGGGGGIVSRLSKGSFIPKQVRILGLLTAILGLLSFGCFLLFFPQVFLIVYNAAIILFSVWLLLLGVLMLRNDIPSTEIKKPTRITITLACVFGIAINTAELFLVPVITEPSSIDNLLAHLQSGAYFGSFISISELIVALLLIPSLYIIHKHLTMEQSIIARISMILMVVSAALIVCASALQFPLFKWAEWYHIIIDSSIYAQFQMSVGMVVTTIRALNIALMLLFSLGLLFVAYQSVKAGPMGSQGVITSIFAILGLALTGLVAMESLIAFPTVFTITSQILLYTFALIAGVLFLKPDSFEHTAVEDASSDDEEAHD